MLFEYFAEVADVVIAVVDGGFGYAFLPPFYVVADVVYSHRVYVFDRRFRRVFFEDATEIIWC